MALLAKGEKSGLSEKSVQEGPKTFYVGAAWDGNVDLDLMIVPVKDGAAVESETVYYGNLKAFDGSIAHSGDATNGDAAGDDESVVIKVDGVTADHLVVGVVAYSVPDMSAASNTKFTIRDGGDEKSPMLYELPMSDDDVDGETVLVSCVLSNNAGVWTAKNVGEFLTEFDHGKPSVDGMLSVAAKYTAA